MASQHIFQALPTNVAQLGADRDELDNGSWFAVVNGTLLRVISRVDPGSAELTKQPVTEDQRMGNIDTLNDFSGESARVQLEVRTAQRAVWEALYGPQAEYLSKTAANAANIVGDPTQFGDVSIALSKATAGHLMIVKVTEESGGGTYEFDLDRMIYPDAKLDGTRGTDYSILVADNTLSVFEDVEASGLGGSKTMGDNAYMGECSLSGVAFGSDNLITYDPSEQYSVTLSDGQGFPQIPEWTDDISAGDTVVILSVQYKYCQFGTDATSSSYQVELPFDSSERRPLELFRMLGDAPGGLSRRMVRRIYPFARVSSPASEATQADDGTATVRTVELEVFPDTTEFGNGQFFFEQHFEYEAA